MAMIKQPRRRTKRPLLPDFEGPFGVEKQRLSPTYGLSASQEIQDACTQLCESPPNLRLEANEINVLDVQDEGEIKQSTVTGSSVMKRLVQDLGDRSSSSQGSLTSLGGSNKDHGDVLLMSGKKRKRKIRGSLVAKFTKVFFKDSISNECLSDHRLVLLPPFETLEMEEAKNGDGKKSSTSYQYIFGIANYCVDGKEDGVSQSDEEEEQVLMSWKCDCIDD